MLKKLILLFLAVGQILAFNFVEQGKRAELFEIMDLEVPTFRVTVPDEKFVLLKQALQNTPLNHEKKWNKTIDKPLGSTLDKHGFEKIKDATLVVEINDTEKEFNKVTFDIGGSSARIYGRQGFNLKIRDKKKDLYGRTQFRIRSDPRDATMLRSKLACDMLNRLGIPSISANYIKLYVNEEYFGFYVLMDAPKIPWVEQVFGEKDTTHLIKCKDGGGFLSLQSGFDSCVNENDEITDKTEWLEFLKTLDDAQTVEEIEDIFDVDQFLYIAAYDYLVGAWDHFFHAGHNYNMYKNKNNGKWTMIYYDFDGDIGQDPTGIDSFNLTPLSDKNYTRYTVRDWFNYQTHIIDIAIWNNLPRFESKLAEFISKVFNPAALFPHIDELKEFIRPFVIHDKTPGENGINPGILNLNNPSDYSIEQWDANCEFTTISEPTVGSEAYGIKYWILMKYRAVCNQYNLECDPVYMDENYQFPIDKEVEGEINYHKYDGIDWNFILGFDTPAQPEIPVDIEKPTEDPTNIDEIIDEPTEDATEVQIDEPIEEQVEDSFEESLDESNE
eukprot:jgi/Orpsp1_1/1184131/evm.model.c7180000088136.1